MRAGSRKTRGPRATPATRPPRRPATARTAPLDPSDDALDDAFPLGDGVAETATGVVCPYCGASVELLLDPGGGPVQRYVEDCEVCCRPWSVEVRWSERGEADARLTREDEG